MPFFIQHTEWVTARLTAQHRGVPGHPGAVLLVGDVLAPGHAIACVVHFEHRRVDYEVVGHGAVPVVIAQFEEHAVTGADDLDQPAAALTQPNPFGHIGGEGVSPDRILALAMRSTPPRSSSGVYMVC